MCQLLASEAQMRKKTRKADKVEKIMQPLWRANPKEHKSASTEQNIFIGRFESKTR